MSVVSAMPSRKRYRFLTTVQVMDRLGIQSRSTLLKLRRQDQDFPKPRLRGGDVLCWMEHEIYRWMKQQPHAR